MALPLKATIALTRIGAGALTYANPPLAAKLFGLRNAEQSSTYTARLFGSRDIALGLAVLSPNPAARKNALRLGVLVDACDTVAGLMDQKEGKLTPAGAAVLIGGAAAFAVMGVLALTQED
jgi:hypothetical protein